MKLFLTMILMNVIIFPVKRRFLKALKDPKPEQDRLLQEILRLADKKQLPEKPTTYADYPTDQSWTTEPILFHEYTSGSSGARKAIPYTASLRKSFQNLFLLWSTDLLVHVPFKEGRTFISISPKLQNLGMTTDLEYLSPWLQYLMETFLVTRPGDQLAKNGAEFREKMQKRLLNAKDLELFSIWSPSYLLTLLEGLPTNTKELWPNLKLISAWGDATSAPGMNQLKEKFPGVRFQKKGLLSTEVPMTVPWMDSGGCVPLWTECYLEVLDEHDHIKPLYELKTNEEAELLISTKGGLLRYKICDRIKVTGIYLGSPIIEFMGREGQLSDLVGEKLAEDVLLQLFADLPGNWSLHANQDHYTLLTTGSVDAGWAETKLREVHHYAMARELGQLQPVRVQVEPQLSELKLKFAENRGQKRGDVKPKFLWSTPEFLHWRRTQLGQPSQADSEDRTAASRSKGDQNI